MVMKKNNGIKRKKIILGVILVSIVVLSIAGTYAFFTSSINNDRNLNATIKTGTMALTFEDNDNGINKKLTFGQSVTKKFKIINTGTLDASLSLDWKNLTNTYSNGSLSYNITYSTSQDGEYSELVSETNLPVTKVALTQTMVSEISVPAGETYYYNLNITLNNLEDVNQADDLDAIFNTEFDIGQPLQYRYYNLSIDPNGGTWKEFISTQNYLLKHEEELEIPDPTKIGYNFDGWKIEGASSVLSGIKFNMGISDTKLTAQWSLKKIKVTIDGVETEVNYGESIELGTKEKEGNTFTGWSTTGGTLEGNTLIVNEDKEITVTPIFKANKYKYIVYHHKMNVDGNGYTLVEADTYEGEIDYGTTVTPEVKTYEGFTSPEVQSLTIAKEDDYPPINNVVNYYYERNKYTLTYEENGTTSSKEAFYGSSWNLWITGEPQYYSFNGWTIVSGPGTLEDGKLTVGAGDTKIKAVYKPLELKVTFNPNGGAFKPSGAVDEEIIVTNFNHYGDYGELPTPVYPSDTNFPNVDVYPQYDFMGWYTGLNDGELITEETEILLDNNTVLYARWKESSKVTLEALGVYDYYNTHSADLIGGYTADYAINRLKPNFGIESPKMKEYREVHSTTPIWMGSAPEGRYYIYGTDYYFDKTTGRYALLNTTVTTQRGDLYHKYVVDIYGFLNSPAFNHNEFGYDGTGADVLWQNPIIYFIDKSGSTLQAYAYTSEAYDFDRYAEFKYQEAEGYTVIRSGTFKMDDNYGSSYYYRGASENNYVKFGKWAEELYRGYNSDKSNYNDFSSLSECQSDSTFGAGCELSPIAGKDMYWRIIRINGDGSLRIIYDGTTAYPNYAASRDRIAFLSNWNPSTSTNDPSLSNYFNSNVKRKLDEWYSYNIQSDKYMSDTGFCSDRRSANVWYNMNVYSGLYGAYGRFKTEDYTWKRKDLTPSFECEKNDTYSLMSSIEWIETDSNGSQIINKLNNNYGNGELTYPVGLITADEVIAAGGLGEISNKGYYLYKGMPYWTMTPYGVQPSRTFSGRYSQSIVFGVGSNGEMEGFTVSQYMGVAPVINISAVTARKLSGQGLQSDPYYLPEVQ